MRSPPQAVAAPGTATFAFWLAGCAHETMHVSFSLSLPKGVRCLAVPAERTLAPGAAELLLLTVFISSETPAGTHSIVLHAEAYGVEASGVAEIGVRPRVDVRLEVPPGGSAAPGGEIVYRLRVENRGNVAVEVELQVRSSWSTRLEGGRFHLPADAMVEGKLVHMVPATAEPGSRGRVNVEIRTLTVPSVEDRGVLWSTVRPPAFSEVPTHLYPLLPGAVHGALIMEDGRFRGEGRFDLRGSIGPQQALSVSGLVRVQTHEIAWHTLRLSYLHSALHVHLGHIAVPTLTGRRVGHGLILQHDPVASPYRVRVYVSPVGSALELHVRDGDVGGTILASSSDGVSLTAFAAPGPLRIEAQLTTSTEHYLVSWREPAGLKLSASLIRGAGAAVMFSVSTGFLKSTFTGHLASPSGWEVELAMRSEGRLKGAFQVGLVEHPLRGVHPDAMRARWGAAGDRLEWEMCVAFSRSSGWTRAEDLWAVRLGGEAAVRTSYGSTFGLDVDAWFTALPLAAQVGRWRFVLSGGAPFGATLAADGTPRARSTPSFHGSLAVEDGQLEVGATLVLNRATLSVAYGVRQFSLSFEARVSLPVPVVMTKGRVEGAIQGAPEEGLLLELDGARSITCSQGRFRMPPMAPGTYALRFLNLPPGLCVAPGQGSDVEVRAGEVTYVQVELVTTAELSGRLIAVDGQTEQGIAGALVRVTNGANTHSSRTDVQGGFLLRGLCPGIWTISMELPDLVPPHDLDRVEQTVELKPGDRVTVDFVARPRARPVRPFVGVRSCMIASSIRSCKT